MPFNVSRTAQFYDIEVMKYGVSLDGVPVKHGVLDATDSASWTVSAGVRNVVPAGTILKLSATNTNQLVKYNGTGTIWGILGHSTDLLAQSTSGDEPVPVYYHNVVFATKAIVGFTQYASALISTLDTCKWE